MPSSSRRRWIAGLVLSPFSPLCTALSGEAQAAPAPCKDSLAQLLKPFSKLVGMKVDFVEEKHIALLKKPLVNRGSVVFMAPDHLVRRIDAPTPSAVWIKRGQLWVRDRSGEKKLDVTRWGPANVLINSFLYVLRGDASNLLKHYQIDLSCENGGWRMHLIPRHSDLKKILAHLTIVGRGLAAESLEMLDGAGDRSITRFSSFNPRVRYTEAQLKRFFSSASAKP